METVKCQTAVNILKCTHKDCKATFNKQSKLDIHLRKHTTERPFNCDVCNKTFTNNSHLRKHQRRKHEKNIKPIRCTHEGCDKVLSNSFCYKRHLKNLHENKDGSYICEVCKETFNKKSQLNSHMFEHTGTLSFKCDLCGLIFNSKTQYRIHRNQEKQLKKHKCTYEGCNAKFKRPSKLEIHIRKHTGERPFKCDQCDKTYSNGSHLRRHKNVAHVKQHVENIRCPYENCHKYLANKYSYKRHVNRYHSNKKVFPYYCDTCHKGFFKKSQFHSHNFQHTGTTPYQCESCNIVFVRITDYKKHKANHKTYECLCKKVFDRWTRLLKHKKTCDKCIKVYQCKNCDKVFRNKSNLKHHIENHDTDDKPFKCTEEGCTRTYKYEKNLNVHVRFYHLKEKRKKHKCPYPDCDMEVVRLEPHIEWHKKPKGVKKIRAVRKDKGTIKRSTALRLTGLTTDYNVEKEIIQGKKVSVEFNGEIIETGECIELDFDDSNMNSETEESDISIKYDDDSDDDSNKESDYETIIIQSDVENTKSDDDNNKKLKNEIIIQTNLDNSKLKLNDPKETLSSIQTNQKMNVPDNFNADSNNELDNEIIIIEDNIDCVKDISSSTSHKLNILDNSIAISNLDQMKNKLNVIDTSKKNNLIQEKRKSNEIHTYNNNKDSQSCNNLNNVIVKTFSIKSKIRAKMIFRNSSNINMVNKPVKQPEIIKAEINNRKISVADKALLDVSNRLKELENNKNENRFDNIFNFMLEQIQNDPEECDKQNNTDDSHNLLGTRLINSQSCSKEVKKNNVKKHLLTKVL